MIDRPELARFLRSRREALQPDDVGLPRGSRRRTGGLRREEVALLAHMSTDYYARIEQQRGPQPSESMIAAIAQGLHLSLAERDHLFLLAGHRPPPRDTAAEHVGPGLLRIFDRLQDTAAEIVTELGETLRQSPPAVALTGELTHLRGPMRSLGYRWFAAPEWRRLYAPEDHDALGRLWVSGLRSVATANGPGSRAAQYAELLLAISAEFRALWAAQEVGLRPPATKRYVHPEVGRIELECQTLVDPDQAHRLLVYTAAPGSESAEKLRLLTVVGAQRLPARATPT